MASTCLKSVTHCPEISWNASCLTQISRDIFPHTSFWYRAEESSWFEKKQKKPALKGMQKPTPALFFVPRDLEVWRFEHKINKFKFSGLVGEHFYVKFGDPSCSGFSDIVRINRQTDRQTNVGKKTDPPPATAVGVGNYRLLQRPRGAP